MRPPPPPPLLLGECWDFRRLFKAVSALLELLGLSSTRERDALRCCTEQRSFAGWWRSRSFRSATFCGTMTVHDAPYYEMYQGTAAVASTGGSRTRAGRALFLAWGAQATPSGVRCCGCKDMRSGTVRRLAQSTARTRIQGRDAGIAHRSSSRRAQGSAGGPRCGSQSRGRW